MHRCRSTTSSYYIATEQDIDDFGTNGITTRSRNESKMETSIPLWTLKENGNNVFQTGQTIVAAPAILKWE
jgi:hypothetical protein